MSRYPNPFDPEELEFDLAQAYPGLHPQEYQDIAWCALNPSAGRTRGREWAMIQARLAQLEKFGKAESDDALWRQ